MFQPPQRLPFWTSHMWGLNGDGSTRSNDVLFSSLCSRHQDLLLHENVGSARLYSATHSLVVPVGSAVPESCFRVGFVNSVYSRYGNRRPLVLQSALFAAMRARTSYKLYTAQPHLAQATLFAATRHGFQLVLLLSLCRIFVRDRNQVSLLRVLH